MSATTILVLVGSGGALAGAWFWGYVSGARSSAAELARLEELGRTLATRCTALEYRLARSKRAPLSHNDAVSVLRGVANDPNPEAG